MKFKVGDRIILLRNDKYVGRTVVGNAYVVESIIIPLASNNYWNNNGYTIGILSSPDSVTQVRPEWLEHEHIYNSPLYKALT